MVLWFELHSVWEKHCGPGEIEGTTHKPYSVIMHRREEDFPLWTWGHIPADKEQTSSKDMQCVLLFRHWHTPTHTPTHSLMSPSALVIFGWDREDSVWTGLLLIHHPRTTASNNQSVNNTVHL